jgi:RimJ/RimL family protein N-acetyltransferase
VSVNRQTIDFTFEMQLCRSDDVKKSRMSLNQLPLETKSLLIRRFVPEDAKDVFILSKEEQYRAWLPSQAYRDESHARATLEFLIGEYSSAAHPRQGPCVLAIEHRADRALLGHVGFSPIDNDVEIGFAIAQRYQGRGLATEAITAASSWAFATFELDKIVGITSAKNTASKRTLVRAKFAHQGDQVMTFQGTEQSVSIYVLSGHFGAVISA